MGCDIHLFAEAKKKRGLMFWKNPKWEAIEKWELDHEYDPPKLLLLGANRIYTGGRNYNLFCALCGVRRYIFREDVKYISDPRGIPEDSDDKIKAVVKDWDTDGHSHNYNTLKEIKEFDWSPYGDTVKKFLDEVIPKMEAVGVKDTDVRIVYFFDN